MIRILLLSLAFVGMTACKDVGKANVESCESWIDSQNCGDYDFSGDIVCSSYEELECDISGYFDCLSDNTSCDGDMPDISGWSACLSQATCD